MIWLGKGIEGDDTHGHVDDICRFVNRTTVVACVEANRKDINHKRLLDNLERLRSSRLEDNGKLEIVPIPMPGRIDFEDLRLPASYANFLITNGVRAWSPPSTIRTIARRWEFYRSCSGIGTSSGFMPSI